MEEPEWLLFDGNENLFNESANSNCFCKFDDGTLCRYNDKHPFAILTYFMPSVTTKIKKKYDTK